MIDQLCPRSLDGGKQVRHLKQKFNSVSLSVIYMHICIYIYEYILTLYIAAVRLTNFALAAWTAASRSGTYKKK